MEGKIWESFKNNGPGSTLYLNGDYCSSLETLENEIVALCNLFNHKKGIVPKLFIDEITAIKDWQIVLKRLYDAGVTRNILIVTTGSQASDLRRGKERLPGRRGKLARTEFYFPPLSFQEFASVASSHFKTDTLNAYLITGGSPLAANELATHGRIPEFVYSLNREWITGECARVNRSRNILTWLILALWRIGSSPVSINQLTKDCGAANNSILQGYLDILIDSLALATATPWDPGKQRPITRRPSKFPWINLLAAWSFLPERPASLEELNSLAAPLRGAAWEWLIAQDVWRRAALGGNPTPEQMAFYADSKHEVDLIAFDQATTHSKKISQGTNKTRSPQWLEVKAGKADPRDFAWFKNSFPNECLTVISNSKFSVSNVKGITFEEFLLD